MFHKKEDKRQKELFQRRGIEDPEIEIVEESLVRDVERQEDEMETAGTSVEREGDKASINAILQLLEKMNQGQQELKAELNSNSQKLESTSQELKAELNDTTRELKAELNSNSQKLEAMESALKSATEATNQAIIDCETRMSQAIVESENNISAKFLEFQGEVQSKMNGFENKMEARLEEVREGINERVVENYRAINEKVDIIETRVENVREEFNADINHLKTEVVEKAGKDVEIRLEQDKKKLKDLEEKIKELSELASMPQTSTGVVSGAFASIPAGLRFGGEDRERPWSFIKAVENYFIMARIPDSLKTKVIYQMLVGRVKMWMDSLEEIPASFETWKVLFLERYWSEELRLEAKMKLIDERYRSNTRESLRDFATRKITTFKACDPRMSESEIVKIVIRQLPYAIQNLLNSVVPINADTLQTLLARYDQTALYFGRGETIRKDVNFINRSGRNFAPRGSRECRPAVMNHSGGGEGSAGSKGHSASQPNQENASWRHRRNNSGNIAEGRENDIITGEPATSEGIRMLSNDLLN